jgi:hypothetical protein
VKVSAAPTKKVGPPITYFGRKQLPLIGGAILASKADILPKSHCRDTRTPIALILLYISSKIFVLSEAKLIFLLLEDYLNVLAVVIQASS